MSRRHFLDRLAVFAGSTVAARALLPVLTFWRSKPKAPEKERGQGRQNRR